MWLFDLDSIICGFSLERVLWGCCENVMGVRGDDVMYVNFMDDYVWDFFDGDLRWFYKVDFCIVFVDGFVVGYDEFFC